MTCSSTLPMHEVREIGRRLAVFMGLPGLGMEITLASFHAAGRVQVSRQWLKNLVMTVTELPSRLRRSLLLTRSEPGADEVRRFASACLTSVSVMGLSRSSFGVPIYSGGLDRYAGVDVCHGDR